MPVIPALRKWRQEDQGFQVNLGYIVTFEANLGYIARFFLETGKKKPIIFYHMIQQSHYLEYIFKGNEISIFKIHLQLPGSLQHYS
jgi:hypothetical protein